MDTEHTIILLLGIIFFVKLVLLRSLRLSTTRLTSFELERRIAKGDAAAKAARQKQEILPGLLALRRILDTLLSVLVIVCLAYALGWLMGVIVSTLFLLFASFVARSGFVGRQAHALYKRFETKILKVTTILSPLLSLFKDKIDTRSADFTLHSKEELLHLAQEAKSVLNHEERLLLAHSLKFDERLVGEIMTPRSVVESINKSEILGPIVLDRLHKTGHSRFPVINKDFDHVVGLLYTHDLVVGSKKLNNASAEKMMDSKVFYINEGQTLNQALAGFLRTRHHLFIVVNEFEETTGVITIEDVIEALIGRKIIDEFDQYADLRAVASRAATKRHKSDSSTHIK